MPNGDSTTGRAAGAEGGIIGRIREGANAQITSQKDRASEGISNVAQAVRQSSTQLREQKHDTVARYIEEAAGQLERFSNRLKEKDLGEFIEDAQHLARRRPALFIGSAFALGLMGARFLKSSPPDHRWDTYARRRDRVGDWSAQPYTPATARSTGMDVRPTGYEEPERF